MRKFILPVLLCFIFINPATANDEINAEATTVLADYIAQHPETVLTCLNLVSVFRKLERSGDHITNIAEEIVFFIDAKVLKHSGKTDEHYPLTKK